MPMEITIKLLENAMRDALKAGRTGNGWDNGKGRFLVDGFPRKMDQAIKFEEDVRVLLFGLILTADDEWSRCAHLPLFCSSPPRRRR